MNQSQRRLLVVVCVLGAVVLHLWNGRWIYRPGWEIRNLVPINVFGVVAWDGHQFEGLAIPVCLLVAALFFRMGGKPAAS